MSFNTNQRFTGEYSDTLLEKGRYIGSTHLKQTDFGITPVRIAGGTVKVKDEVEMSFEIVPTPPSGPAPAR